MGYDREHAANRFNRKQKYRYRDKDDSMDKVTKKRNSFYKQRLHEEELEVLEEEIEELDVLDTDLEEE